VTPGLESTSQVRASLHSEIFRGLLAAVFNDVEETLPPSRSLKLRHECGEEDRLATEAPTLEGEASPTSHAVIDGSCSGSI
jgi:hypothetical protein